jgi:undecaprenyl-diphosphatase
VPHLTYLQAIVIGLLQGVTELFPVSSLGHGVLLPAWVGGSWARTLDMSADGSPYLAFLVAVHVATAIALVAFFRRDWVRIVAGLVTSIRARRITTPHERLAWLLLVATVPVGAAGLALDHVVRTTLGRPIPAAAFLALNGAVLYTVERLRRRRPATGPVGALPSAAGSPDAAAASEPGIAPLGWLDDVDAAPFSAQGGGRGLSAAATGGQQTSPAHPVRPGDGTAARGEGHYRAGQGVGAHAGSQADDARLARLSWGEAIGIGAAQILALLPGVSRSGSTIAVGLLRGLDHEDAARFAFLLATPVIAAAGLLKVPDLTGAAGAGIHGQVLVGSLVAGVAAYVSLRWLTRYFATHTLTPFAIYCAIAGVASLLRFTLA